MLKDELQASTFAHYFSSVLSDLNSLAQNIFPHYLYAEQNKLVHSVDI